MGEKASRKKSTFAPCSKTNFLIFPVIHGTIRTYARTSAYHALPQLMCRIKSMRTCMSKFATNSLRLSVASAGRGALAGKGVEVAQEDRLEGCQVVIAGYSENPLCGENGGKKRRTVGSDLVAFAVAKPDGRSDGGVVVLDPAPDHPLPVLRIVGGLMPGGDPAGTADFSVDWRTAEKGAGEQHPVDIARISAQV